MQLSSSLIDYTLTQTYTHTHTQRLTSSGSVFSASPYHVMMTNGGVPGVLGINLHGSVMLSPLATSYNFVGMFTLMASTPDSTVTESRISNRR